MGFKDKILDPQSTTSTQFAGDTLNAIADYFSAVDMTQGGVEPANIVDINTETLFSTGSLKLWDTNKEFKVTITTQDYAEDHTLTLPTEAALGTVDEIMTKESVQTVIGKTMDFTTDNTAQNIPSSALPNTVLYNTVDNDLGQHYLDVGQLSATPADPPSLTRRLFVDTNGHLSIRTAAGSTIDIEQAATGDSGGIANAGSATFSGNGSQTVFNIPHNLSPQPDFAFVEPATVDATGARTVTVDATNVIITYNIAPITGVNNIVVEWFAGYDVQAEAGFTPSSTHTLTNKTIGDALVFDTILTPTDPAANKIKVYAKAVDANNDGYFAKTKLNSTIVEVRVF